MIDKEQYQRTFGVLHASALNLKEEPNMKSNHFPIRRALTLCAAVLLVLSLTAVCYGADVGGIRRTIQLWVHGDQTTAVMDIQEGSYTLSYEDADGNTQERGGGGVAIENDGSERPLTDEELLEHLNQPEIYYQDDGTVWAYWKEQAMEITDKFNDEGICFLQMVDGDEVWYLTVRYENGYSMSREAYVQPEKFNCSRE